MLKKVLCLALAVLFALSVAACGGSGDIKNNKKTSGKTSGKTDDRVTSGGVKVEVEDEKVLETELATKDYKNKSFIFYYWYQYGDIVDRKVTEFNKQHNANVKVQVISGSFQENIAKSIASGTPYDLIANHALNFPQSIFADLYEPLEGYIDDLDYFDSAKPDNGGISKTVNEAFQWKGKLYACGSAKSVYQEVLYYNKLKFQNAGLEDPYELWKNGKWTWEKFVSMGENVTDLANNIGFLSAVDITMWWTVCGIAPVSRSGDTFKENLGSQEIITATQNYANLFYGDNPISVAKTGTTAFDSGKAYTMIAQTDGYTKYADNAKKSGQFGRNASNLGVVPLPTGLTKDGKYPGHAAQGYSAAKGAKEPSLACAYALFESRTKDQDIGTTMQMDPEVRNYVEAEFAKNGFLGFEGLKNSEGVGSRNYLDPLGADIRNNGADPTSTIANARSGLARMISDSLVGAF